MRRSVEVPPRWLYLLAVLVSVCSATVLLTAPSSNAAQYLGCDWGHPGISYKSNMSSSYETLRSNSMVNWSNNTVISFNASSSNPDFTIIDGGYGNTGWDGITYWSCSGGTFVKGTLVRINRYWTKNYSNHKTRSVISHELGHVVGLDHRTTSNCTGRSVMYPNTPGRFDDCGIFTVQNDDINGTAHLY